MPEIIAENIYPSVIKDHSIPVLTMVFDEQMARAGLITRIEAFIDLMERRRMKAAKAGEGLRSRKFAQIMKVSQAA